ncbi:hypothetical protein HMPREF9072_00850 [Capnocytophaga sp. oral taxon 324 str. F0483]|nr:hypothetical protein HMPREF9072_00850 [Capnocytophaga sp. oral taxon 324 str. F0483]
MRVCRVFVAYNLAKNEALPQKSYKSIQIKQRSMNKGVSFNFAKV